LNPSPQNSLAFEFRNSVVYCRVGQLCLPSLSQQIPWAMLLHGPQDRDVFFVKKRNYSVYVVKVVIGANCAQGGPEKGGICVHLIFSSYPGGAFGAGGRDRRLEASEPFTSKNKRSA